MDEPTLVARHPLTGVLFRHPLSVVFPTTDILVDAGGQMQILAGKHMYLNGQPPQINKATRPKTPVGDSKDSEEKIGLTSYTCPSCKESRVHPHKWECALKKKAVWKPLDKEGLEEKAKFLQIDIAKKPGNSKAPPKKIVESKPSTDDVEEIKSPALSKDSKSPVVGKGKQPAAPAKAYKQMCACICPERPCKHTAKGKGDEPILVDVKDEASVDPLDKVDPLRATTTLTDKQEEALRTYFNVLPTPSRETLDSMTKDERNQALEKTRIPKWAVRAVLAESSNLKEILSGSLDVEKFQAGLYKRQSKPKDLPTVEVAKKWVTLKERYKGVDLLENPKSNKEKSLKKAFDLLKSEVGDHPALPKPGQGSGRRSPNASRQQASTSGSAVNPENPLAMTMSVLEMVGALVKAMK
jgi:hypothetical protein